MKGLLRMKITIDNQEYDVDNMSDDAKAQLTSLQFVDSELARLQAQIAVFQTARNGYANALRAALPAAGDTIKFS
jgi:hypothetical protein